MLASRVKTQNAHHCNHALPHQEDAWGATYQFKDGWQEDSVRDVTRVVKDRARKLPEALYAHWRGAQQAKEFWTSPLRGNDRLTIHQVAYAKSNARVFARVDDWGPMDDSRGRCLQTWHYPTEENDSLDERTLNQRLDEMQGGQTPTWLQCKAILMLYFRDHVVDEDLPEWWDIWRAEKEHYHSLSRPGSGHSIVQPPDYKRFQFQVYHTFKLGEGSSIVGDSVAYVRSSSKDDSWLRCTSYQDQDIVGRDILLDYGTPSGAAHTSPTTEMMKEVSNEMLHDYTLQYYKTELSPIVRCTP